MSQLRVKFLHAGDVGRTIHYGPTFGWASGVITAIEHLDAGVVRVTTSNRVEWVMHGEAYVRLSDQPRRVSRAGLEPGAVTVGDHGRIEVRS